MNPDRSSAFAALPVIPCAVLGLAVVCFGIARADAQETRPETPEIPAIREVAPGVFEIGKMVVDKNARSVTFPGAVNLEKGLLEYLIVTREGPTHESLLVSDIPASDLHFAMLLLGAKGAGLTTPGPEDRPPPQIDAEYLRKAPKLKGDPVFISVKWKKKDGAEQSAPIEDWLRESESRKAVPRGPWIYTGSMFADGKFLAQIEG
ncbi:MAG: YdjY domain-containing protein, partial [Verrucomicrobiota bacterium]|nr:YdjY domain-containing protein [Verrucomicrobiota bacterium]